MPWMESHGNYKAVSSVNSNLSSINCHRVNDIIPLGAEVQSLIKVRGCLGLREWFPSHPLLDGESGKVTSATTITTGYQTWELVTCPDSPSSKGWEANHSRRPRYPRTFISDCTSIWLNVKSLSRVNDRANDNIPLMMLKHVWWHQLLSFRKARHQFSRRGVLIWRVYQELMIWLMITYPDDVEACMMISITKF